MLTIGGLPGGRDQKLPSQIMAFLENGTAT
jgi:hypothetical protein